MLYLRPPAASNRDVHTERVPVAELTAIGLERALLAPDIESRRRELMVSLTRDPAVLSWVIQAAECGAGGAVLNLEESASWLADCLAAELAHSLVNDNANVRPFSPRSTDVEIRLPALANRLAGYERELASFDGRLEREKLEAMKELAYGASHEINNPLANIAARAQTLLQEERDPERQRKLSAIHRQAMRAHEMIADLMLFARPPKLERVACDLRRIVEEIVDEHGHIAHEQETQLTCQAAEQPLQLMADTTQLAVAVNALIRNALEAVGDGGHVEIAVRDIEIGGKNMAEIAVRDNGPGISDDVRRHMFDPFYSGREAGRGLGFGLSKCWRIVTDHGGEIVVHRPAAGGAEIAILLPLSARPLTDD